MVSINRILKIMVVVCLSISFLPASQFASGQAIQDMSNQYTQMDTVNTDWKVDQTIPPAYVQTAENDNYRLYTDQTTLAFIVVDKRSGYVWYSSLVQKIAGDRLNKSWTAFAQSGISIEYLDQKAVSKRVSITNSATSIEVEPVNQGIEASVSFTDYGITIQVRIRLETDGVNVEVPFESIKQSSPDYKLGILYVYPFFGATRADSVPGYMFIPDGAGALIRFSATTKATNMFYGKYYGADLGMITELPHDWSLKRPYTISMPVFGMVHGYKQNAYIVIVEKGAAYGELEAHPSGVVTNFNFMYNIFTYNEAYFQATNRSGDGVTILQHDTNKFDVSLHYRFLTKDDSDYVGMAKDYQRYLVDKGMLKKIAMQDTSIGIRLEFLGGEKEKVLVWNRLIPMTTVSQMANILDKLGFTNQDVILFGWQPLGASTMPPKTMKIDPGLGSLAELRTLAVKISAAGGNFYLYLDPQAAAADQGGYSSRNDLAMSITDDNLRGWSRMGANFFFNFTVLTNRYTTLSKDINKKLSVGLALDGIGSILYSDFKSKNFMNREDASSSYQKMFMDSQAPIAFYQPNVYLFSNMRAYYDTPISDSGYLYTTDLVPFLEIVLAGYVPYYGPALNFSPDMQGDLLRQIDFGVYPSYFLTQEVTAKMLNTRSNWIYTSSFAQWGEEIEQSYEWMNSLLAPVVGQEITSRQVLQAGVVATTYANGKQIIVNYNDQPVSAGNLVINGKDAILTELLP